MFMLKKFLDSGSVWDIFQTLVTSQEYSNLLSNLLNGESEKIVLDLGCGTGKLSDYFLPEMYTGIDPSRSYISVARLKFPEKKFVIGDHNYLENFENESVDLVLMWGVMHHIDDLNLRACVMQISRILKCGGVLLSLEPSILLEPKTSIVERFMMRLDYGAFIRKIEFYEKLVELGFQDFKVQSFRRLIRLPYHHALMRWLK